MDAWQQHLEKYLSFLRALSVAGEGTLRFCKRVVAASDVAEQFFCEKKVEMQYLHREIETEAKMVGTEAHEKLLEDTVPVKREMLWQRIYGKNPVLVRETLLLAKHRDIVVAGKPDSILFRNGLPLVVFEHKFSKSSVDYLSYHVQAQTYCLLLENMGFNTSKLFYAIVVADPVTKGSRELRRAVNRATLKNGPKEGTHSIDNAKVYICKFNRINAEKNLDWALEFWGNRREAEPASNQNKCARCEYRAECR